MPKYYTVVTESGINALREAVQEKSFSLTKAVVGDGDGSAIIPNKGMTTLVNQVWIGDISGVKADSSDPNTLIFEFAIPADTGDFTIREVGLLDSDDQLFCVGNFPETVKPVAENGSVRDLVVRLPLHFENADVVNLVVNAAVALATKQDLIDHNDDPLAHRRATEDEYGFTQYATPDEHKAKTFRNLACTPFGVWELIKSLMSSSVASSSTDRLATPKAVKTVQDNLNAHNSSSQAHRHATENVAGFTQLAKAEEHLSSSSARRDIAATPYGVWNLLTRVRSDAVDLASTWRFATSKAVKTVMDALNGHTSASDPHHAQARVDSKMQGHLHVSDPHGVVAKVKALLSSSTSNTSTTTFATPKAVKTVNDWLTAHKNGIDPHGTVPRVKELLSSSVTSASTTTFATPKAVKVVNDSLNTHKNSSTVHIPSGGSTGEVLIKQANGGIAWGAVAGVPVGQLCFSTNGEALAGTLPVNVKQKVRCDLYPQLFEWMKGGNYLRTESAWDAEAAAQDGTCGKYCWDGGDWFILPCYTRYFAAAHDGKAAGSWDGDAIRNITGEFEGGHSNLPSSGAFYRDQIDLGEWNAKHAIGNGTKNELYTFDVSRVVPTAEENRPKTSYVLPCIKAFDVPVNAAHVDMQALAQQVAAWGPVVENMNNTFVHGGCIWFDGAVNAEGRPIDAKSGQPDLNYGVCDGRTYQAPDGRKVSTINARDRFIVVAGGQYNKGGTGGAEQVSLSKNQNAAHQHEMPTATYLPFGSGSSGKAGNIQAMPPHTGYNGSQTDNSGVSQSHENRPPYIGLFLIKRL